MLAPENPPSEPTDGNPSTVYELDQIVVNSQHALLSTIIARSKANGVKLSQDRGILFEGIDEDYVRTRSLLTQFSRPASVYWRLIINQYETNGIISHDVLFNTLAHSALIKSGFLPNATASSFYSSTDLYQVVSGRSAPPIVENIGRGFVRVAGGIEHVFALHSEQELPALPAREYEMAHYLLRLTTPGQGQPVFVTPDNIGSDIERRTI